MTHCGITHQTLAFACMAMSLTAGAQWSFTMIELESAHHHCQSSSVHRLHLYCAVKHVKIIRTTGIIRSLKMSIYSQMPIWTNASSKCLRNSIFQCKNLWVRATVGDFPFGALWLFVNQRRIQIVLLTYLRWCDCWRWKVGENRRELQIRRRTSSLMSEEH